MTPIHCNTPMTCLGWAKKQNGHKIHWCPFCGAVLVQRLLRGQIVSSELQTPTPYGKPLIEVLFPKTEGN